MNIHELKKIISEEIQKEINEGQIFDASKEGSDPYMEVYRLDKLTGKGYIGPYRIDATDFLKRDSEGKIIKNEKGEIESSSWDRAYKDYEAVNKITDKFSKAVDNLSPEKDFLEHEFQKTHYKKKGNLHFAFQDLHVLLAWFPRKYLQILKKYGYRVRKIKAKKVWMSKSKKQVIFEPLTSLMDGEIIKL